MEKKVSWIKKHHHHIVIGLIITVMVMLVSAPKPISESSIEQSLNGINQSYKEIHTNLQDIHSNLKVLARNDSIMNDQLLHYPSAQPLPMSSITRVSSVYSERKHPITGKKSQHTGIDYVAQKGTPVYATANGVIKACGYNDGYGKQVKINHLNGYESTYAHLSTIDVQEFQQIKRGDKIGTVGSTGNSTGYHLHYEVVYEYKYLNPRVFYSN